MSRRGGAAGMRRSLRSGGSGGAPAASFDRADLGLVAGWDPDSSYVVKDGADRVSLWQARWAYTLAGAPTTYDVRQATGAAQPLWEAGGLLGRPSLYFTTDDFLETVAAALAGILDGSQAVSFYVVAKREDLSDFAGLCSLGDSGSSANAVFWRGQQTTGGDFLLRGDSGGQNNSGGAQASGVAPARFTLSFGAGIVNTWIASAASIVAAANTRTPACDLVTIGAARYTGAYSSYFKGPIGHVLLYGAAHDASQRAFVWGLLQAAYPGLS